MLSCCSILREVLDAGTPMQAGGATPHKQQAKQALMGAPHVMLLAGALGTGLHKLLCKCSMALLTDL